MVVSITVIAVLTHVGTSEIMFTGKKACAFCGAIKSAGGAISIQMKNIANVVLNRRNFMDFL
jgi:hypothetical protein